MHSTNNYWDFPGGSDGKSVCLQCKRLGFDPWVGNIPWRRKWQPTPVFLPGKFHGQRSLAGYSPRGQKELHMMEHMCTHTQTHTYLYIYIHTHIYTYIYIHYMYVCIYTYLLSIYCVQSTEGDIQMVFCPQGMCNIEQGRLWRWPRRGTSQVCGITEEIQSHMGGR